MSSLQFSLRCGSTLLYFVKAWSDRTSSRLSYFSRTDWSWDNVLTYTWTGVRIPAREVIVSPPKRLDCLWDQPSLLPVGTGVLS